MHFIHLCFLWVPNLHTVLIYMGAQQQPRLHGALPAMPPLHRRQQRAIVKEWGVTPAEACYQSSEQASIFWSHVHDRVFFSITTNRYLHQLCLSSCQYLAFLLFNSRLIEIKSAEISMQVLNKWSNLKQIPDLAAQIQPHQMQHFITLWFSLSHSLMHMILPGISPKSITQTTVTATSLTGAWTKKLWILPTRELSLVRESCTEAGGVKGTELLGTALILSGNFCYLWQIYDVCFSRTL